MSQHGHLIIFEGADGVGKTELSIRLAARLTSQEHPFSYMPFPGRAEGSLGLLVYKLHHTPRDLNISSVTPSALQALHVAAHLDGLEIVIIPSLMAGISFVLDRFWWSTIVYGRVNGISESTISALLQLERSGWGDTLPDVVFLISRLQPLRAEPLDFWRRTKDSYQLLAKEEHGRYPIVGVDNDGEPEATLNKIVSVLKSLGMTHGTD
jgi:dTMP kinase